MVLSCRRFSSSRLTLSRTAPDPPRSRADRVGVALERLREERHVHRRLRAAPGRPRHSSSIVTERIGASRRARPSTTVNIAVWPERLAADDAAEGVHAVLGHVDVERAHVDGDELVRRLEDGGIVVVVVRLDDPRRALGVAGQQPAVDLLHAFASGTVRRRRVEVVEVGDQHPQHVADLAVGLDRCASGSPCRCGCPRGSRPSTPTAAALSAPLCVMTSCGATPLPSDFDILRPSSAMTKPWVSTWSNGARPRVPMPTSSELWNQPRCWSLPSR